MTREETRQKIINAARSLFSEKGYRGTTTAGIAKKAGVSEVTLYRHFQTKKDLFRTCLELPVDEVLNRDLSSIMEAQSLEEFVEAVLKFRMQIYDEYYETFRIMFNELPYSEDPMSYLMGVVKEQEEGLEEMMGRMRELGEIKRTRNSFMFALAIRMALWQWVSFRRMQKTEETEMPLLESQKDLPLGAISPEHLISDLAEFYLYGVSGEAPRTKEDEQKTD